MSVEKRQRLAGYRDLIREIGSIGFICFVSLLLVSISGFFEIMLFFAIGFIAFGLLEYFIHRFAFHLRIKKEPYRKWVYDIHGVHHKYPSDQRFYKTSIYLKIALVLAINIIGYSTGGGHGLIFSSGFGSGYAFYLFVHYIVHHYNAPKNSFKFFWVYHEIHHHINPKNAYGVSNPFWDMVFQTYPRGQEFTMANRRLKNHLK